MPALLNLHPDYLDDCGGVPVSLRVYWSTAERANHGTPGGRLPNSTQFRLGLFRMTAPGVWEVSPRGYVYSGIAAQGHTLYATPANLSFKNPLEYLHGWAPLLAVGVYWPKVEYYDVGTSTWTVLAGSNPIYGASGFPDDPAVILERMRHEEVYRVRQGFPASVYPTGPQRLELEV